MSETYDLLSQLLHMNPATVMIILSTEVLVDVDEGSK